MFKRASLTLAALLAAPAAAAYSSQTKAGAQASKVSSFTFCARPIVDSYSQQPVIGFGGARRLSEAGTDADAADRELYGIFPGGVPLGFPVLYSPS